MAWVSMPLLVSSAYSVLERQNGMRLPPMTAMRLSEPSVMCRILWKMLGSWRSVPGYSFLPASSSPGLAAFFSAAELLGSFVPDFFAAFLLAAAFFFFLLADFFLAPVFFAVFLVGLIPDASPAFLAPVFLRALSSSEPSAEASASVVLM